MGRSIPQLQPLTSEKSQEEQNEIEFWEKCVLTLIRSSRDPFTYDFEIAKTAAQYVELRRQFIKDQNDPIRNNNT